MERQKAKVIKNMCFRHRYY